MHSRRELLKSGTVAGGSVLSAIALDGKASGTARAADQRSAAAPFDFDTGNAIREVVIPTENPLFVSTGATGADVPLAVRHAILLNNAWFDSTAPYHPTAVGVASKLGRRPASEGRTNRNRNIAIMYASLRVLNTELPQFRAQWRAMMTSVGLNPDDTSENTTTPVGIGNKAGNAVLAFLLHDGMNQLGDEGGRKYNRQPFANYVGYRPVNTAHVLRDPSRWQPNIVTTGNGIFRVQEFITPQMAITRPYSFRNPAAFDVPPPSNSDWAHNRQGYKRQTDVVLKESAELTDAKKLLAENIDDKFRAYPPTIWYIADSRGYSLERYISLNFMVNVCIYDGTIAAWHFKRHYDSVRPFSAVRLLYGDKNVTAWGGPGKGTVNDIKGREWRSYINTADHPEYPSTSSTLSFAHAQAARRFTGTDEFGYSITFAPGSSLIEPGITPRRQTTLSWDTWTAWSQDCARARLIGGVHFPDSLAAGSALGKRVGDIVYDFVTAHIRGQTP
ncbi:vanadium-dependent haloperoxidase [Spirillospora sp. NPDC048911]|uniref:vanadium-dependent haloperoxidase n=1 Tax=Spirillospora sp. NPDC048911 TaxID=3364527 RepID=UPI0037136397